MSDSDGVEEIVTQGMRVAITAAARAGEAMMRYRQSESQRAAEESQARAQELQELQERLDAEMLAARTAYRRVDDPAWWASASPKEVAKAYETATAWHDVDKEAARFQTRIEAEVLERSGATWTPPTTSPRRSRSARSRRRKSKTAGSTQLSTLPRPSAPTVASSLHGIPVSAARRPPAT